LIEGIEIQKQNRTAFYVISFYLGRKCPSIIHKSNEFFCLRRISAESVEQYLCQSRKLSGGERFIHRSCE